MKLCASRAFWLGAYSSQSHEMLFDAHTRSFAALGGAARQQPSRSVNTATCAMHGTSWSRARESFEPDRWVDRVTMGLVAMRQQPAISRRSWAAALRQSFQVWRQPRMIYISPTMASAGLRTAPPPNLRACVRPSSWLGSCARAVPEPCGCRNRCVRSNGWPGSTIVTLRQQPDTATAPSSSRSRMRPGWSKSSAGSR